MKKIIASLQALTTRIQSRFSKVPVKFGVINYSPNHEVAISVRLVNASINSANQVRSTSDTVYDCVVEVITSINKVNQEKLLEDYYPAIKQSILETSNFRLMDVGFEDEIVGNSHSLIMSVSFRATYTS